MIKFQYGAEPIIVSRGQDFNIAKLLVPENRKKTREIAKNPNYVNSKYMLKEVYAKENNR